MRTSIGRYRRQFRLEVLEPRVLLCYGTTDDPLDSQAQLLAFLRRKVEDESLPSSFSDAQPLAPLAAGEAFVPIADGLAGGEAGASLLPAVEDRPAQPAAPPLFVRVSDATATEGHALVFTVSLSAPAAETVQVAYLVADGTATAESGDYQKLRGQVSFAPGQTVQTISVPTADDDCQEGDEHFWLVLHKPRGARIADGGGTGVIIDNDSLPKINISNVQVQPGETATFFVILSNPYREPVSVQYATVADTPAAMGQFEPVWGMLTFQPGEVAARVAVPTLPTAENTAGGSFSVVLSDPQNAQLDKSAGTASFTDKPEGSQFPAVRPTGLKTSQGQASLGDGGQMGMLSVQTPTVSVYLLESSSPVTEGQSAIVVFELSHSVDYDVAIQFQTAPGTADASDYYHSEGTVLIPAGSSIEWLWLYTVYDYLDEDDEHFWLVLNDGGYFSAPSSLCIPIIDDDAEPVVSIYDDTVNEGENSGYSPTASLLVALSAPSGREVLVDWRTWPGTADQYDYSGGSGQLHFLPQWDPWLWVEIPVNNDPVYEPEPEQFFVELWGFQNCSPGDTWAVCTIYDDDPPPQVNISDDQQCSEPQGGSLTLTFTVSLSQPCQEEVTVTWQTQQAWWSSRALATADEDYRSAGGTVVFAPYETTPKTIEVTILDDCYAEEDEDFAVYLTGTTGGGASTGRSAALVTIRDYDHLVDVAIDSNNDGVIDISDEWVEDVLGDDRYPGKIILVSDFDTDNDGLLDWADGFDWLQGIDEDDVSPGTTFVPLHVTLSPCLDLESLFVHIDYPNSDPASCSLGDFSVGYLPRPIDGTLRIWKRDSWEPRNPASADDGGDFVRSGVYTAQQLGFSPGVNTLFVEAVRHSVVSGGEAITISISGGGLPEGVVANDRVRVTCTRIEVFAHSGVEGESGFQTYSFIASRLPKYDDISGEPLFNDWLQQYSIRVYDPRNNINLVRVAGHELALQRNGEYHVTTSPVIIIRQAELPVLVSNQPVEIRYDILRQYRYAGFFNPDDPNAGPRVWNVTASPTALVFADLDTGILSVDTRGPDLAYTASIDDPSVWVSNAELLLNAEFRILEWDEANGENGAWVVLLGDGARSWYVGLLPDRAISYEDGTRTELPLAESLLDGQFHTLSIYRAEGSSSVTVTMDGRYVGVISGTPSGFEGIMWGDPGEGVSALVEIKSIDWEHPAIVDTPVYSERPSDVVGSATVIALPDGFEPVLQYNPEQPGARTVYAKLAEGSDKTIALIVDEAVNELVREGWTAPNPADSGAWGKAVSQRVRQKLANKSQWLTGVLVDNKTRKIIGKNAVAGTTHATEVDVIYLAPGYKPELGDVLDQSKIVIYEIKSSALGSIDPEQLNRLKAIQGGDIRKVCTKYIWKQSQNRLVENVRYLRQMDLFDHFGIKTAAKVFTVAGIVVSLSQYDSAYQEFENEMEKFYTLVKNRTADDLAKRAQGAVVCKKLEALLNVASGGTMEASNALASYATLLRIVGDPIKPHWQFK